MDTNTNININTNTNISKKPYEFILQYNVYYILFLTRYNIAHSVIDNIIYLKCKKVSTFKEYILKNNIPLNFQIILKIIYDIGYTFKMLDNSKQTIMCFSLDDLIVLDDEIFFYINLEKILQINKNNMIILSSPININNEDTFIESRVYHNTIPLKLHYSTGFYSFACLIIYLLTNERYDLLKNDDILKPIYNTKVYYFILRCLNNNLQERCFLYI